VDTKADMPENIPGLVSVSKPGRTPAQRRVYRLYGTGTGLCYGVHNNSLVNLRRGIAERVLYIRQPDGSYRRPPQTSVGVFHSRLEEMKCRLRRHLPSTTPIAREDFPLLYKGRKKVVYQEAVGSLRSRCVERRDAGLKTFTKAEKINFSSKPDGAPRVIQPRDPRYNVEVGRYLKPVEGAVYRAIGRVWGDVTVAKGLNAEQRGKLVHAKWREFRDPAAVGLDASRFDQHVGRPALEWEHSVYMLMNSDPELSRLLSWQIHNKGKARAKDGHCRYEVEGCRMSGDMNTALGNCLLMSSMVWAYAKTRGVKTRLINDGDDCVVFMEKRDLLRFTDGLDDWFTEMGFTMKVEPPAYELEQVEFCQCKPVWTPEGYLMVRSIAQSLAKDSISLKPLDTSKVFKKWCNEVGECGLSLTGGIPVVSNFYKMLMRASDGAKSGRMGYDPVFETGMRFMARGMDRHNHPIDDHTRFSFYLAFGVTPTQQELWEAYYDSFELSYTTAEPTYEASPSFLISRSIPQAFSHFAGIGR